MKKIFVLFCVLILTISSAMPVYALNSQNSSGVSVEDYLPQDTIDLLKENGIDSFDFKTLLNLDIGDFLNYVIKCVKNEVTKPLTLIYIILLIVIVIVLSRGINGGFLNGQLENNFSIVGVLCVSTTLAAPIIACLEQSREFIVKTTDFIMTFIPSFAAVMFASGHNTAAVGYQATMIVAVEFISSFLLNTVITLLYMFLAFSIVSKIGGEYNLDMITKSLRTIVTWSLTLVISIFVALITIKGIIGVSADSLIIRTGKFFVGSFVPAVGAALAEAATTLQKSVGLIKNSTGIFGIIAVVFYFVPPLIKILVYKISLNIASAVSKMFGINSVSELLGDASVVLSLVSSIILSYAALLILSTAVILCIGGTA